MFSITLSSDAPWQSAISVYTEAPSHRLVVDDVVVCGNARLDRDRQGGAAADRQRDLRTVALTYIEGGIDAVTRLNGSFGVVLWDSRHRRLHAVRDALGLSPLYYRSDPRELVIADSLDGLRSDERIDADFIATFIATGGPDPSRTIWKDSSPLPPGSVLTRRDDRTVVCTYWSPLEFGEAHRSKGDDAAAEFRRLVREALSRDLDPAGGTWAHLSGGHDSSSVVSMAAAMQAEDDRWALGGTLTLADSFGSGDESTFSDLVLDRYRLRNERLDDVAPWTDDGLAPPRTPHPTRDYPFFARDRIASRQMRAHGATSLLSGLGPDLYLPFTALHATDLFWSGRPTEGLRLACEWSIARGERLWTSVWRHLMMPVVPRRVRLWARRRRTPFPAWMQTTFIREHGFADCLVALDVPVSRRLRLLPSLLAEHFAAMSASLDGWLLYDGIEIRHPLLYRPLVEFCLSLPSAHRMDVRAPKPVLRHAMQGIVPDAVLARRSKGAAILPRVCWALARERHRIAHLLRTSALADLGVIEPAKALHAAEEAAAGRLGYAAKHLYYALSIETWFAVRNGRYAVSTVH
ncbi:MAG TPA: asparagine synthase-related protein [Vicinamibacterales bacterium]|nr:asparagine synthase-related protein [Vicinamibacterales bacterium]